MTESRTFTSFFLTLVLPFSLSPFFFFLCTVVKMLRFITQKKIKIIMWDSVTSPMGKAGHFEVILFSNFIAFMPVVVSNYV